MTTKPVKQKDVLGSRFLALAGVLCLPACGLPLRAQTAPAGPTATVTGATVFYSAGNTSIQKTDGPADFQSELAGQHITVNADPKYKTADPAEVGTFHRLTPADASSHG